MQTITTKYLGCTNTKPSRIKAQCEAASIYMSYDHELNSSENHMEAAKRLRAKMKWKGQMIGGHTKSGMCFVFNDPQTTI